MWRAPLLLVVFEVGFYSLFVFVLFVAFVVDLYVCYVLVLLVVGVDDAEG